jgi:hypothetical protein
MNVRRKTQKTTYLVLAFVLVNSILICIYSDYRLMVDAFLVESQSITSVTTLPVCAEVFGNETLPQNSNTNKLCGAKGSQSLLEPVTIINLSVRTGTDDTKSTDEPDKPIDSGERLTFYGFPESTFTQQQINNFNPNEPCKFVQPGTNCSIFTAPSEIRWRASPIVSRYRLKEITDEFPFYYLKYSAVVDYGIDDEGEGDISIGSMIANMCTCGVLKNKTNVEPIIGQNEGDCRFLSNQKFGGKHTTNYGHYIDESCAKDGNLYRLATWFDYQKNIATCGKNCPCRRQGWGTQWTCGAPGPDGSTCSSCNKLKVCDGSCGDKDIRNNASWYSKGTIAFCAGLIENSKNTADIAVELSGPCHYFSTNAVGRDNMDPASIPLRGTYTDFRNQPKGYDDLEGSCIVCIANYKSTSTIPGITGNWNKCGKLVTEWRNSFVTLLSTNDDQNSGQQFSNAVDSEEGEAFYYRSTDVVNSQNTGTITKCCRFVLSSTEDSELVGRCTPSASGDYCWGSYTEPPDFVDRNQNFDTINIGTDNFPSGFENSAGGGQNIRGLAMTPYFMDVAKEAKFDMSAAHLYRCGHYCSEFESSIGARTKDFDTGKQTKNPIDKGYVKGWVGLGPFCKAYEVSLFDDKVYTVDVDVTYPAGADGKNRTERIHLTSDGIGSYIGGTNAGVVAKINGVRQLDGGTLNKLGGVLVVCGASTKAIDGARSQLSGTLGPGIPVTTNPWSTIQAILSKIPHQQFQVGDPAPIPSFITVLQCFSFKTACLPPKEICEAAFNVCDQEKLNCKRAFKYIGNKFGESSGDDCTSGDPCKSSTNTNPSANSVRVIRWDPDSGKAFEDSDGKTECLCCSPYPDANNSPQGQAWFWLPEEHRSSFGKECGQYGMPLQYGKDDSTAQYVCSSPGDSVRCAPGFDTQSIGTNSPCEIIGGMVNYNGRTSCSAYPSSASKGQCMTSNDGSKANSCNDDRKNNVGIPEGMPLNWNRESPNYWVDFFSGSSSIYFSPNDQSIFSIELELFVSGAALGADIINISNGKLLTSPLDKNGNPIEGATTKFCSLVRGGNSQQSSLPIYVENLGTATASYTVHFIGCAGISEGQVRPVTQTIPVPDVKPGKFGEGTFSMIVDSSIAINALTCTLSLSPSGQSTLILDSRSVGCSIAANRDIGNPAQNGIDTDGDLTVNRVECQSAAFWCSLANGGWETKALFWIVVSGLIILTGFAAYIVYKVTVAESRVEKQRKREYDLNRIEQKQTIQREEIEEEIKDEDKQMKKQTPN